MGIYEVTWALGACAGVQRKVHSGETDGVRWSCTGKICNLFKGCDIKSGCRIKTVGSNLGSDSMCVWGGLLNNFLQSCRYILWVRTSWAALHSGIWMSTHLVSGASQLYLLGNCWLLEDDKSRFFQNNNMGMVRKQTLKRKCREW